METPRRRALGKGLEELFSTEVLDFDQLEEKIVEETPKEEILELKIDDIRTNPYQPRKIFDEQSLNELASSIKEHGVFQPIIVKKSIKGYEIVAGERRVRACKIAGLSTVPAIVRNFDDSEMMIIALLENLQREDLNPIEEGAAYLKIVEDKQMTREELAKIVGKSESHISNMIGLLRLPEEVKDLVIEGKLAMAHARILSKMRDKDVIIKLAKKIIDEGLSVRDLEEIARSGEIKKVNKMVRTLSPTELRFKYAEDLLCKKFDSKVRVFKNKLEVKFKDEDDLNRILEILNIEK